MSIVVRVDRKGRVVIPKDLREKVGIREGSLVQVRVEGGRVVIEPVGSIAIKYYASVKIKRWPKDLDEFFNEAVRRWASQDM